MITLFHYLSASLLYYIENSWKAETLIHIESPKLLMSCIDYSMGSTTITEALNGIKLNGVDSKFANTFHMALNVEICKLKTIMIEIFL